MQLPLEEIYKYYVMHPLRKYNLSFGQFAYYYKLWIEKNNGA
jgi:hypothetical protein